MAKIVDGNTTKYYYDGDQVIAEYDGSNTLLRKFVYGPGIDEPICMIDVTDSNAVYYYHFDGLGSVVALSDVNSVIVERYSYDVFGEPNRTSDVNNPYMFTGRRLDPEAGLYYYRARYYSPELGRFLQPDPIGYAAGLNLYMYVGNNPLNWIDPWGLMPQWYYRAVAGFWSGVGTAAGAIHDTPGYVTELVMWEDFTPREIQELSEGFWEGYQAGEVIAADAYTFGLIDPLNQLASEKVSEYGAAGKWSRRFGYASAAAAYSAVGVRGARGLGLIDDTAQGNNYFRIISKPLKRGFRIDKAHHGKWIHPHYWKW